MLRTKRLVMLPLSPSDLDEAAAVFGDPRVMMYIDGETRDRATTAHALEANQRCWKSEGWGLWAIRDATSGAFLGQAGLQRATEIIGATVEFGLILSRRNCSEIHAIVHPDNPAGSAVLRKLGFRRQEDELIRGETQQVWQTQRLG